MVDPMAPFGLGFKAGILGYDPRACPYDRMTREWNEWQRGLTIGVVIGDLEILPDCLHGTEDVCQFAGICTRIGVVCPL